MNIITFLKNYFYQKLEALFMKNKTYNEASFGDYKLIKLLKKQSIFPYPSIGIYKNRNGKEYIIKSLNYIFKNSSYFRLLNEAKIYKTLNKKLREEKINQINFPEFNNLVFGNKRLSLAVEYIPGKKLSSFGKTYILDSLNKIVNSFNKIRDIEGLQKKSRFHVLITFPIYLFFLLIRDIKNIKLYIRLGAIFFKHSLSVPLQTDYYFAHRDLHVENIISWKNKLYILDPEVAVMAEKHTDLAILTKSLTKISKEDVVKLIEKNLNSDTEISAFISLLIYYTIQIMSIRQKAEVDYIEAKTFIDKRIFYFIDRLQNKGINTSPEEKSLYERVSSFTFNILSYTQLTTRRLNNSIILCYHSINSNSWRFTTQISEFEKQISFLKENYSIATLDDVLKRKNKNAVAITFDDGYQDIVKYAYPILEKNNLTATLFVLGDNKHANRDELDNNLPLLSIEQIRFLHKKGWEIGCHTNTHANLATLSKSGLENEIIYAKKKLEKTLGFPIKYFAYPRGIYNTEIVQQVKRASYHAAFTVDGGKVNFKNSFLIPRIGMEGTTTIKEFKGLLTPGGLFMSQLFMSILKYKESITSKYMN